MFSICLKEMTWSTSMLVRPISTSSRMNDRRRTYDATTILDDEKKGVFRVLQIGRPKDEERKWRKRGRQQVPLSENVVSHYGPGLVWNRRTI